jgi:tRNA pseudouridine55 synthase
LDGILLIDKPAGPSSRAVLNQVAQLFRPERPKLGHAGTLDPLASGLLVVAVGQGTRLVKLVQAMPKTYQATVRLGAWSETDDAEGPIHQVAEALEPDSGAIQRALEQQTGQIRQVPPRYSAVHVGGRRAYALARAGQKQSLESRLVRVDRIDVQWFEWPRLALEIQCGSGTYVRSIARDVGAALGCGAYIENLRRTKTGAYDVVDAIAPPFPSRDHVARSLRSLGEVVADLPRLVLSGDELVAICQGQAIGSDASQASPGQIALFAADGELAALGVIDSEACRIRPTRVFARPRF